MAKSALDEARDFVAGVIGERKRSRPRLTRAQSAKLAAARIRREGLLARAAELRRKAASMPKTEWEARGLLLEQAAEIEAEAYSIRLRRRGGGA